MEPLKEVWHILECKKYSFLIGITKTKYFL